MIGAVLKLFKIYGRIIVNLIAASVFSESNKLSYIDRTCIVLSEVRSEAVSTIKEIGCKVGLHMGFLLELVSNDTKYARTADYLFIGVIISRIKLFKIDSLIILYKSIICILFTCLSLDNYLLT